MWTQNGRKMKYADYRKSSEKDNKSIGEIKKDKEALQKVIMTKATQQKTEIVDRLYEIIDIGAINIEENLATIVKESEWLYAYGFNLGCISVVGLVSEEFSEILADKSGISKNSTPNQKMRIEKLLNQNAISKDTADKLDYIRDIRNQCVHYNPSFESLDAKDIQAHALKGLNYFKKVIVDYYSQVDAFEHGVLTASNHDEMALILRNAMAKNADTDLIIANKRYLLRKRVYQIMEIDIDGSNFKEMTLFDMEAGFIVIVDLTYSQADYILGIDLKENQCIIASCISIITANGLSEEWQLLNIDEILY